MPWRHFIEARYPGVGVYRGGGGQLKGAWKPTNNCVMKSGGKFCPICREQLVLRIYTLVDPIDGCTPDAHLTRDSAPEALRTGPRGAYSFQVDIMQPKTHGLEVRWWVLPENEVPKPVVEERLPDRRKRGKLNEIRSKPAKVVRSSGQRKNTFRWKPPANAQGRFRVICRVRDGTKPSGQAWPWVLRDLKGILESERAWWVTVQ